MRDRDELRYKCQTDLYFLASEVLQKDVTEYTHRQMCDFFVKKDPKYKSFREFADAYEGPKDRMMLVPRKAYKSTLMVIDELQWMICFPEISIIRMTAELTLAEAFIQEFKSYLVVKGGKRKGDIVEGGEPTDFQR